MKALLLNGARTGEGDVDYIAALVDDHLRQRGWDTIRYTLRDHDIKHCIGCFDCWVKTPGECIIKGDHHTISQQTMQSDLLLLITPIVFGSYSSQLKKMIDHQIPLVMPFFKRIDGEIHHQTRYDRYPAFVGIGLQRTPDATQAHIFRELVQRNAINLHAPFAHGAVWQTNEPDDHLHDDIDHILFAMMEVIA